MGTLRHLLAVMALMMMPAAAVAQSSAEFNLWAAGPPTSNGDPTDTAKIYVYLPDKKIATGRAVVVCPGGGYDHLALDHEGRDWAPILNGQGLAVIVLKYRMPHGNPKIPVQDAEQAIRLTRTMASSWNIDPAQVGIMGFSAGGHLASVVATRSTGDAAPTFQILFYPVITMEPGVTHTGSHDNLLGRKAGKKQEQYYSTDRQVTRATPRAFIALSDDDHDVLPANGVNYYMECYRHDVPASLHVYPKGGHGWGIRQSFPYYFEMMFELKAWLHSF